MKIKSSAYKENLIYLTLWLILFIAPASSMYMRVQNNSAMSMDWSEIFHVWNLYTAYLIIFLIHNFILAPLLIYKKKKVIYLATTICLITIFVIFQFSQKPKDFRKKMEKHSPAQDSLDSVFRAFFQAIPCLDHLSPDVATSV